MVDLRTFKRNKSVDTNVCFLVNHINWLLVEVHLIPSFW